MSWQRACVGLASFADRLAVSHGAPISRTRDRYGSQTETPDGQGEEWRRLRKRSSPPRLRKSSLRYRNRPLRTPLRKLSASPLSPRRSPSSRPLQQRRVSIPATCPRKTPRCATPQRSSRLSLYLLIQRVQVLAGRKWRSSSGSTANRRRSDKRWQGQSSDSSQHRTRRDRSRLPHCIGIRRHPRVLHVPRRRYRAAREGASCTSLAFKRTLRPPFSAPIL